MGYLVAVLLPLIYRGIPNPIGLQWMIRYGNAPMPPSVLRRATTVSAAIPYVQVFVLGAAVAAAHWLKPVRLDSVAASSDSAVLVGLVAGAAWVALSAWLSRMAHGSRERLARHYFNQQTIGYWIPLLLTSAVVEESWRAYCLLAFPSTERTWATCVTAVAFGFGHGQPLGRVISSAAFAVYVSVLFLSTGSLIVAITLHAVVNLATIGLVRYMLRRV